MPTLGRADWLRRCAEGWAGAFMGTARWGWAIGWGNWKLLAPTLGIWPCIWKLPRCCCGWIMPMLTYCWCVAAICCCCCCKTSICCAMASCSTAGCQQCSGGTRRKRRTHQRRQLGRTAAVRNVQTTAGRSHRALLARLLLLLLLLVHCEVCCRRRGSCSVLAGAGEAMQRQKVCLRYLASVSHGCQL
jgi:hypothetical protein